MRLHAQTEQLRERLRQCLPLAAPWEGTFYRATQAIGRIAWEEKLEGIVVPSARRKRALNIVLFPSRRQRGSSWKIHRARKLPRKDDK